MTFASSCARTTWTIASVSRMFARNLLPRPSPLCAPAHEAGDVVEVDRVVDDVRRADRRGDPVEPLVAHRHDGDVRLDRRERVVRRLGARPRERVEQRGLARVGHADDADLHRRRGPPWRCRAPRPPRCRTGSGRRGTPATAPSPAAAVERRRAGSSAPYARAAANDDEACALGNDSAVGVGDRARGSSSNAGRWRRTTPLIAVFSRYAPPTVARAAPPAGAARAVDAARRRRRARARAPRARPRREKRPTAGVRAGHLPRERTKRYRWRSTSATRRPTDPGQAAAPGPARRGSVRGGRWAHRAHVMGETSAWCVSRSSRTRVRRDTDLTGSHAALLRAGGADVRPFDLDEFAAAAAPWVPTDRLVVAGGDGSIGLAAPSGRARRRPARRRPDRHGQRLRPRARPPDRPRRRCALAARPDARTVTHRARSSPAAARS